MEAAVKQFELDVTGMTCLDAGLSTGGFTDCLLQQGALKVYGVDVGAGQVMPMLDSRLPHTLRGLRPQQQHLPETAFDAVSNVHRKGYWCRAATRPC